MSVQVQLRRGAAANIATFTPAQGECVVDETNNRIIVGDGSTVGGWPAARLFEAGAALGANGSSLKLNVVEIALSALSGATVTAANALPAGVLVVACAMRVTTAITGATSFSIGYTGSTSAFGSGLGISAGSVNQGLIGPNPFYSATNVVVTAAGGNFTAGAVRLSVMYLSVTPPTS
jgi:Major tropism determinant N-terminal domain